jgi:hypothetical protein
LETGEFRAATLVPGGMDLPTGVGSGRKGKGKTTKVARNKLGAC